ncbi:MAG: class I SAM-dependent methyltransferase [Planctomycetota bacterium]
MDPELVSEQLRCPSGNQGSKSAFKMNANNRATNLFAIKELAIADSDFVLEIGPGNGAFVADILKVCPNIQYRAVDWSEDMVNEAIRLNFPLVRTGQVKFVLGQSDRLPFSDNQFNKALSVHTIYFWDQPQNHFKEIARVLKPGSRLCLAFGQYDFMEKLSFTKFNFQLYHRAEVIQLLEKAGFKIEKTLMHEECGESNSGERVEKQIEVILAVLN